MVAIACSFCGTVLTKATAKDRVVAGPQVFICRDCVGLCIEIFGPTDAAWREEKIAALEGMREDHR